MQTQMANGAFTRDFGGSGVPQKGDIRPRFYMDTEKDEKASQEHGRPIFHEVEMVEMIIPGNPHTKPVQRVRDDHRARWPEAYDRFKAGQQAAVDGTPIEEWSPLTKSQCMELKALGFQSVEELAAMNESAIQRIGMGGRTLQQKAKAYIEQAMGNAPMEKMAHENELLRNEVAAQKTQIADLGNMLKNLTDQVNANAAPKVLTQVPSPTVTPDLDLRHEQPSQGSSLAALEQQPKPARTGKTKAA